MSFNPTLDRTAITQALQTLGKQIRSSGTVYLFGGTALILQGIRAGSTQDLDLWSYDNFSEVDQGVQYLKRHQVSVDFIDPETFLPLPPGWEQRSAFAGQYGSLIVRYLDPYTIALTKISRNQSQDRLDIQGLATQGLIQRDELIRLYQTIAPLVGSGRYGRLDPAVFDQKFTAMLQHITW